MSFAEGQKAGPQGCISQLCAQCRRDGQHICLDDTLIAVAGAVEIIPSFEESGNQIVQRDAPTQHMGILTGTGIGKIAIRHGQPPCCRQTLGPLILKYAPALDCKAGALIGRTRSGFADHLLGHTFKQLAVTNAPGNFHHRWHQPWPVIVLGKIHQMEFAHELRMNRGQAGAACNGKRGLAGKHQPPFTFSRGRRIQGRGFKSPGLRAPHAVLSGLATIGR